MNTNQTKHTPGPWKVIGHDSDNGTPIMIGVIGGNVPVCDLYRRNPDNESNARLIAAAPDMLEALKDAKRSINSLHRDNCPGEQIPHYDFCAYCRQLEYLDAAIARAEGRGNETH